MSDYQTEQEAFWAGNFGDSYIGRNSGQSLTASNTALFAEILAHTREIDSVIEFGANIGLNLQALRNLLPKAKLAAVEINSQAVAELEKLAEIEVFKGSILDYKSDEQFDLALIKTVLIHINPEYLPQVYQTIFNSSRRYICIAEYYNPTPTEINYRGHERKLFKRDFAGEMLDTFADLRLVSYGFRYHRDNNFVQDDINWFLLEKIDKSSPKNYR